MNEHLGKAIEFIRQKGQRLDFLRLEMLLNPSDRVLQEIESLLRSFQNPDGGWGEQPYGVPLGPASNLTNTYMALRLVVEDLQHYQSPLILSGVNYILAHRLPDHRFDDDQAVMKLNPPGWMKPGREVVIVWKTAAVANTFLQLPDDIRPDLHQTYEYLMKLWQSNQLFTGYYHASWWIMAIAAKLYGIDHEAVHSCAQFLQRQLQSLDIQEDYMHTLEACHTAGFPSSHPLVQTCFELLDQTQQPDGSWVNEFGEPWSVDVTLRVLRMNLIYHR